MAAAAPGERPSVLRFRYVACVAIAGSLAGCGGANECRAPRVVVRASRHVAALLHDRTASSGTYVRTTRSRATSLVGGNINAPDQPVYLVVLRGHFGGGRFAPGRLADFTVNARSGRLLDLGTSNRLPSLSPLGRLYRFRLGDCSKPDAVVGSAGNEGRKKGWRSSWCCTTRPRRRER